MSNVTGEPPGGTSDIAHLPGLNNPVNNAPKISEGTESGWAAVAKSIREVDEEKIKDYKEDIDTILVFAGLYSAVLTALLGQSLTSLQPDSNATMIKLMSQVVMQTQSFSFTNGHLNSTAPPLDINHVQDFQPSLAAKRVNVLWFASLTLSLISASFGILVKQWLREYLAGEYISPQARLRIRHFRTPGLEHWSVFAIAALLPLVLQLALALFFVGLCFFTLDIDSSVGYTCIPLVAGWALLFVTASVSPILSPRCPYKIPIFKDIMQGLRNTLFHTVWAFKGFPTLPDISKWPTEASWSWWSLGYSEGDATKDSRQDINILATVDASQTDDRLVVKVCSALTEMDASPDEIIDFVVKAINFRLQRQAVRRPVPPSLDLSQLSAQTCTILMDAIAAVFAREIRDVPAAEEIPWTPVTKDCLNILVARLPCHLSQRAAATVASCFQSAKPGRATSTCATLYAQTAKEQRPALCLHIQSRLQPVFDHLNAYEAEATMWQLLYQSCCSCPSNMVACNLSPVVLQRHADVITPELKQSTCTLMTAFLLRQIQRGVPFGAWHRTTMLNMVGQWGGLKPGEPCKWYPALSEAIRLLVTQPQYAPHFYRHLYEAGAYSPVVVPLFQRLFTETREVEEMIGTLHHAFALYVTDKLKMPGLLDGAFYIPLMNFILTQTPSIEWLLQNFRQLTFAVYIPLWRRVWVTLHAALSSFDSAWWTPQHAEWAVACLRAVDNLDNLSSPPPDGYVNAPRHFELWASTFNTRNSFFDDDIIRDLLRFLPTLDHIDSFSWRGRRIVWMQRRSQHVRPHLPGHGQGYGGPQQAASPPAGTEVAVLPASGSGNAHFPDPTTPPHVVSPTPAASSPPAIPILPPAGLPGPPPVYNYSQYVPTGWNPPPSFAPTAAAAPVYMPAPTPSYAPAVVSPTYTPAAVPLTHYQAHAFAPPPAFAYPAPNRSLEPPAQSSAVPSPAQTPSLPIPVGYMPVGLPPVPASTSASAPAVPPPASSPAPAPAPTPTPEPTASYLSQARSLPTVAHAPVVPSPASATSFEHPVPTPSATSPTPLPNHPSLTAPSIPPLPAVPFMPSVLPPAYPQSDLSLPPPGDSSIAPADAYLPAPRSTARQADV